MRATILAQGEVSASDISKLLAMYTGVPEGVEFIISNESCQVYGVDDDQHLFPALATALRGYTRNSKWESVIRKLIRRGDDIHARVPPYPGDQQAFYTSLDEFFSWTRDPFEGRELGNSWLQILLSEGFDVRAYLEKEQIMHTPQWLTIRGLWGDKRQLVFELGECPSVSWRWWWDPSLPACLLLDEFANCNIHHKGPGSESSWTDYWPFDYPEWSDFHKPWDDDDAYEEWKHLHEFAESRAERRWRKRAAKLGQLDDYKEDPPMPGTWPEED